MRPRSIVFTPRRAALLLGICGLATLLGYSLYVALPYLEGPSLEVSAHAENEVTVIEGKTERVSYLQINGAPVALSEDGSFSIRRSYPAGYTALTAQATDRFGRGITKTLHVVTTLHGTEEKN